MIISTKACLWINQKPNHIILDKNNCIRGQFIIDINDRQPKLQSRVKCLRSVKVPVSGLGIDLKARHASEGKTVFGSTKFYRHQKTDDRGL